MIAAPVAEVAPVPAPVVAAADEVAVVAGAVAGVPDGSPVVATVAADVASAASDVSAGKGLTDLEASLVRTLVPSAVGEGITLLASTGIHISTAYEPILISGAGFALGALYYYVARKIEQKYPKAGWLLGVPRKPVYTA